MALIIPIVALTLSYVDASAQTGSSTLVGTVRDSSDAVVPDANVTIVNQDTGVTTTVISNSVGNYEVPFLADGIYTVSGEFAGFQKAEIRDVKLDMRTVGRVDLSLKPGKATDLVSVTTTAPLLKTDNAEVGSLYTLDQINELPIGRNFAEVQLLTPGVARGYASGGNSGVEVSPGFVAAGGDINSIDFSIDGADNNSPWVYHNAQSPSMDLISEVKVSTGGLSAEFGRGSAAVEVALKSGTNRFHGSLFDYLGNNALDARDPFATEKPNPLHVNEYGLSLGGPIIKNKLFFIFGWNGLRNRTSSATLVRVPTADERAGVFSAPVQDPQTGQPFPNNTIPADRVSPFAAAMLACCSPLPNDGLYWRGNHNNTIDMDQFDSKVDYIARTTDVFAFSWGHFHRTYFLDFAPTLAANITAFQGQRGSLTWTHTFGPQFINTALVGIHGERSGGYTQDQLQNIDFIDKVGMKLPFHAAGYPNVSIPGINTFGAYYGPVDTPQSNFQMRDIVRMVKGKHSLSAGGEYRLLHQNPLQDLYTRSWQSYYGGFSGSAMGDFLLGLPGYFGWAAPVGRLHASLYQWNAFFQDDWKVTQKLTVNLGLRYEFSSWPVEKNNLFASAEPGLGKVALASDANGKITSQIDPVAYASAPPGTFVPASSLGLPRSLRFPDKRGWAPRIGFAYRLLPTMTIRGHYGMSSEANPTLGFSLQSLSLVAPFTAYHAFTNTDPTFNILDPLANYSPGSPPARIPATYIDPHMRNGNYQTWGLNIQKALPGKMVLDVGYQGTHGTHLEMRRYNYNQSYTLPDTGAGRFPAFTTITGWESNGNSRYDALQAILKKHVSRGLDFTANYTWSKSLDDGATSLDGMINIYDRHLDWGPSAYSHSQIFSAEAIYELPFGRGKTWGNNLHPILDGVLGGWQLSGIFYAASGDPLTIDSLTAYYNLGVVGYYPRADLVGKTSLSKPTMNEWFNTSAFATPPPGREGNSSRGVVTGPASYEPDLAMSKNFRPGKEDWRIQFRAEMYNAFNHHNLGDPDTLVESQTFGKISTLSASRIIKLALRFDF